MKRAIWLGLALTLAVSIGAVSVLAAYNSPKRTIRRTVEVATQAAEAGINRRDLSGVELFFATEAEGANLAGLEQTLNALRTFTAHLGSDDQVQLQTLQVPSVVVHENGGLARATYRLHIRVTRGDGVIYAADVEQNLALLTTPRGWRISGGDQSQVTNVIGTWRP